MTIKLVVFDLAGTTVNDPGGVNQCFRAALAEAGLNVEPAAVNAVMGLPKPEAVRQLLAASPQAAMLLPRADAIHAAFVARMCRFYETDPSVHEVPGSAAVFAMLRRAGIKVALNTGFSRDITRLLLQRLGWREGETVDATVTSDEVARGRPHPDMIRHLMGRLQVYDPVQVAKVGDTAADLEEGTAAGCGLVIGVTQGSQGAETLKKYPHTHLLPSVADLPRLFASLGLPMR